VETHNFWLFLVGGGGLLGGLLLNVFSSYVKEALDRYVPRAYSTWRKSTIESKKKFDTRVAYLVENPEIRNVLFQEEMRFRSRATTYFLASIATFILMTSTSILVHIATLKNPSIFQPGNSPQYILIAILGISSAFGFVAYVYRGLASTRSVILRAAERKIRDKSPISLPI
jgi:hypothetical protein